MSTSELSPKNTKNEILDAYHEVLQQLKEAKKITKTEIKREQDKQTVIEQASGHTTDGIVKQVADLKLSLVKSLEALETQWLNEQKQLTQLQQAITVQTQDLEELYEIKVNADTLAALLEAQKQRQAAFDREMTEQRQHWQEEVAQQRGLWKQEQEATEQFRKEQEVLQKKTRQREEEAYSYQRDLERQKEQDQYEAQKHALEKELTEKRMQLESEFATREAAIAAKETELAHLTSEVEAFPARLQAAVAETNAQITERLQFKYEYEAKLTQKEGEGERKLHEQMIAALQAKIVQQEQHIHGLTEKANQAGIQVQDIAVKAIEGASRQRFYPNYAEKTGESGKA